MSAIWFGVDEAAREAFDAAYFAWLDPRALAVTKLNDASMSIQARLNNCTPLLMDGLILDPVIFMECDDPYESMIVREAEGFVWYPGLGQAFPSDRTAMWSGPVPPGAIRISSKIADYPPFAPDPPPIPFDPNLIGPDLSFQMPYAGVGSDGQIYQGMFPVFSARAQAAFPEGHVQTTPAGKFLFHIAGSGLMDTRNRWSGWLKVA